nr:GspE/PulE family protein [uncultured Desulfobulbus sp.]
MAVTEATLIEAGIRVGLVDAVALKGLRLQAKRERLPLLEVVTRAGRFPEVALYQALADSHQMEFFHPSDLKGDAEALAMLPRTMRQQKPVLPVRRKGERYLVLADPEDLLSVERAERAVGCRFIPALAEPRALRTAVLLSGDGGTVAAIAQGGDGDNDPVELFDQVMKEVYLRRASDIHFEPIEGGMRVRLRVDGQMQDYGRLLSMAEQEALMNRIKVLASLDIAEQRMAQDGALKYTISDWDIPETDIRVATIPTRWGERGTMRILGQETGNLSLEDLGMPPEILGEFRRGIARPYGMILVTGPTGSGKSTTLYAAIRELNVDKMNVLTVEDPVEQPIVGVSQVQVSGKVNFAQALRSFLRHDPDVILVGEMRDRETVEIGMRAAMTGHLVLSTLHTNDSVGAVTRLADIGAERFLIGSTLIGVLAQRLVRRLCRHCRKKRAASPDELRLLGRPEQGDLEIYEPVGCSFCLGSGYRGRVGIYEALWIDNNLRVAIAEGAGENEIRRMATGLRSLWQDGCAKVLAGEAALNDVLHLRAEE